MLIILYAVFLTSWTFLNFALKNLFYLYSELILDTSYRANYFSKTSHFPILSFTFRHFLFTVNGIFRGDRGENFHLCFPPTSFKLLNDNKNFASGSCMQSLSSPRWKKSPEFFFGSQLLQKISQKFWDLVINCAQNQFRYCSDLNFGRNLLIQHRVQGRGGYSYIRVLPKSVVIRAL